MEIFCNFEVMFSTIFVVITYIFDQQNKFWYICSQIFKTEQNFTLRKSAAILKFSNRVFYYS